MNLTLLPSRLSGTIRVPASKSEMHRLLISASLCHSPTRILCGESSEDIRATADCITALGCKVSWADGIFTVIPPPKFPDKAELDCGESGATLRFLMPVLGALGISAVLRMRGRLPKRPVIPLWEELERHGCRLSRPAPDILTIAGKLDGGEYDLPGDVSSQFISGMLLALPLLPQSAFIHVAGPMESQGYVTLTRDVLRRFGVKISEDAGCFTLRQGDSYCSPGECRAEGDWSSAAFWLCAAAVSGMPIRVEGLPLDSTQGDRAICALLPAVLRGNIQVDCRNIPDLVPILAVAAAAGRGRVRFIHAGRLRTKESDRLRAAARMLCALGGDVTETFDGLVVVGHSGLTGGTVDSCGDHRIAMSAAVAQLCASGSVSVLGAEAAAKSYPGFWRDYVALGGRIREETAENIYLIGMPGCGKTTVGRLLARNLQRPFCDTDEMVCAVAGRTIPEIFQNEGEGAFRRLETETLRKIPSNGGCIVATGGGCVTIPENLPLLCGRVVWLQRALERLPLAGRPISEQEPLARLYESRHALYERCADIIVPNDASPEETALKAARMLGLIP